MEIPIILWQPVEGLFMYPTFLVVPESTPQNHVFLKSYAEGDPNRKWYEN